MQLIDHYIIMFTIISKNCFQEQSLNKVQIGYHKTV